MRWMDILRLRLRSMFGRRRVEGDLDEELRFHLDHLLAEQVADGMPPDAARAAVRREFGGMDRIKEECRDARGVAERLTDIVRDVRFATRLLRRTPGFTAAAILIVALGLGATTAMFSVVYGVMLRPLPYGDPDRLVQIWSTAPRLSLPRALVGAANYRDWRAENHVFEDIALARSIGNFNLVGDGEPERVQGSRISANLLPLLRVTPRLGRGFTEDEDEIGHDTIVLLSDALWRRRFGGDPGIIGRKILLSGSPHLVVGVMGPEFQYPNRQFELWVPLTIDPDDYVTRMNYSFLAVARLKPDASVEAARAELDTIAARLQQQYQANKDIGVAVEPMLADTVAPVRRALYVLLGAVGAMLLIGCANLANLLLARALARGHELTLRGALGASRGRLIQQSLTELLPILTIGGVLGLVAAYWLVAAVVPLMPPDMPRVEGIGVGVPVLLVSALALVLVALLAGLWPALQAARMDLAQSLREGARGTTGDRGAHVRDGLVLAQIALTLVLLVGASLLVRSFVALTVVDPGFRTERVLSAHLAIPRSKYGSDAAVAAMCGRVLERVRALPGVESAGMVNRLPLGGVAQIGSIQVEGADPAAPRDVPTDWRTVTPDYFRTIGIPLIAGRSFTDADAAESQPVGIIDERLARAVFRDRDPIGRRFRIPVADLPWVVIVGVVGHIRNDGLDRDPRPQVYWNYLQRAQDRMALVVKTRGRPDDMVRDVTSAVRSVDPEQPLYDVRSMEAVMDRSLTQRWLQTALLAGFAGVALVLACVGIYGLASLTVGQRVKEFGVRMALGASRGEIVSMVLCRAAALGAFGAALGLAGAVLLVRVLNTMLFNVSAFDAPSFVVSVVILLAVALLACVVPARRAASVDPTVTLRAE